MVGKRAVLELLPLKSVTPQLEGCITTIIVMTV